MIEALGQDFERPLRTNTYASPVEQKMKIPSLG
jgi:hypothetical protein